jgi:Ser/Thr protein kinase RdoA (MazF antagonist)
MRVMDQGEIPLTGGNITPAVRIGATVHRRAGPWTPAVHALLRHLEARGFDGVPRVLGVDGRGREVLTYIEGEAGYFDASGTVPPHLWSEAVLLDAARLLRRYHDATEGFVPPPGANWQLVYPDTDRHEVICHNDFAPYNCIFRAGRLRAMIDFDTAGPGPRVWDVAYAAYRFVPLIADERCPALGLRTPPDRERRLRLFCDAYGLEERGNLVETIERRVRAVAAMLLEKAGAGDAVFESLVEEGHAAGYEADADLLRRARALLQHSLRLD